MEVQHVNRLDPDEFILDLSEWSCDEQVCGVLGPHDLCAACSRRARCAAALASRGVNLRSCYLDCSPQTPCESCREVSEYLAVIYRERDSVAAFLRLLRRVAKAYPEELRDLLAMPVYDIVREIKR